MNISVELEDEPGIRFHEDTGHCEVDGHYYEVSKDFGGGTYIHVDGEKRFRLSPEALIQGIHNQLFATDHDGHDTDG